jgi:hypothetical protein
MEDNEEDMGGFQNGITKITRASRTHGHPPLNLLKAAPPACEGGCVLFRKLSCGASFLSSSLKIMQD